MLDINPTEVPSAPRILNEEHAIKWIEELIQDMATWRNACNVHVPGDKEASAKMQRRSLWTFLSKQGQVTGALKTLLLCGIISDRCYREFNQKAINSLIPTTVGNTGNG
jgi:hypothetical protein